MQRFINPQKSNYYNDLLSSFSQDNKPFYSGVVKNFSTKPMKWIADYLFKHSTNTSTNPHSAFISFFSDREMVYEQYGNIPILYNAYPFLQTYLRQQISPYTTELSSEQYRIIGQENTDIDLIQFINASKQLVSLPSVLSINHNYNYNPVFHAEGYKLKGYANNKDKFIWANKLQNPLTTTLSNFIINLGADQSDVTMDLASLQYAAIQSDDYADRNPERTVDYKIQVDHKAFFYFQNESTWVVYHTKFDNESDITSKPYIGAVVCYDNNGLEIKPQQIQYFPEIMIEGKIEPAKIIITWAIETSGKCAFYPGVVIGQSDDQSRLLIHLSKHMFTNTLDGAKIYKSVDDNIIYDGIDLYTERNRRHYATVMTEPYLMTTPLHHGTRVQYKFINRDGEDVSYTNEAAYISQPGMYLKIKCNLDMINAIDKSLSLYQYNTDIINTLTIQNPQTILPIPTTDYYHKFNSNSETFYRRQDDGLFDLLYNRNGEISPKPKHMLLGIHTWLAEQRGLYEYNMNVAGLGFYTDITNNIETEYLSIYCTNYLSELAEDFVTQLITSPGVDNIFRVEQYEKFKPLLKLNGINGYIKILKKNQHFSTVLTTDGKYEVVYNVEFPYCPGSHTERYLMNFSDGYKYTQILYPSSYISAGNNQISSRESPVSNYTNDRYAILSDDSFTYTNLSASHDDVTGGSIIYPGARVTEDLQPGMISSEVSNLTAVSTAYNYQVTLSGLVGDSDYHLFILSDNRRWKYSNQWTPYINRENPSYIFAFDVSALYNDYTIYQKQNACIPDMKRWLLTYIKGIANTSTIDGGEVSSLISRSDVSIDIWDNKSLVGSTRSGNWRSLTPTKSDNNNVMDTLIIDSLYSANAGVDTTDTNYYTFQLGYYNNTYSQPTNLPSTFILNNSNNLVLFDSLNSVCYHVVSVSYLEEIDSGYNGLSITIYAGSTKPVLNSSPDDITSGPLQLFTEKSFISNFKEFELYSSKAVMSGDLGLYKQFIDIRTPGDLSDFDRYVSDNKIYVRFRVNRSVAYPTTKINKDNDALQYITAISTDVNNPWKNDGVWDQLFDYRKVGLIENVATLGLEYVKLTSL